jgi:hypothetical protein
VRQCCLYAKSDEALAALMAQHRDSAVFADRAIAEAARYVRNRPAGAAGRRQVLKDGFAQLGLR